MSDLDILKSVLRYNPRTGLFHWKIRRNSHGGCIYPGDVAGSDKDGYIQIIYTHNGKRHQWRAHRLAWWFMTGKKPTKGMDIGHDDSDRANNRWKNIVEVTRTKNMQNLNDGLRSDNKSGYRGVSWKTHRSGRGAWHARIKVNKQVILLGDYDNKADAIAARKRAEREHF